jgi:protein-tyrosine phosphatase
MVEGTMANTRDIAGLAAAGSRRTRAGVLLRGEAPHRPGDTAPGLRAWPPKTVIDLRSSHELGRRHPFRDLADVRNVPLLEDLAPEHQVEDAELRDNLGATYEYLLTAASESIAGIAEAVATAPAPILVHCAAGKDRTGVVVAVLLRAVGVRRKDVVADYLATNDNLPALMARLEENGLPVPPEGYVMLTVHRQAIDRVLDVLDAFPGGARGWLVAHGVGEPHIEALVKRLVSAGNGVRWNRPPTAGVDHPGGHE